ncbi:porin [Methylophilus sp. QUAN]|uniref:porin n=1 Tax=Methylophilus sp. QUAN TaxID=2781020 RepID=UPI00188F24F7|nr:porin [Methylophilus sp. QUAN]MBF4991504.1 porin [Methylophilus sp. QUAN]
MNLKFRRLLMATLAGGLLTGLTSVSYADSTTDLVQALISKGVLTEEEGALLMKGRTNEVEVQKKKESKSWTSRVNMRGYVQNRVTAMIGNDGDNPAHPVDLWSDRSVGTDDSINPDKNFLIRRARIIIFGDFGDHLSYYIQPDFASSASGTNNIAQLRDAYGDINIDKAKVHRVRVGQSKVPYGFENLQSSSNRLAMDRVDAMNSAVRDERDTGAFYYYTPENVQALFKEINDKGLKHSGNYGMVGVGLYNGQGANRSDVNDNYHVVARATYPWKTESGQIYEAGIQAYSGDYQPSAGAYRRTASASATTPGVFKDGVTTTKGIKDERVGVSFIMYPQPFGLQAEWNWGTTPGLDTAQNRIEEKHLQGGYVQAMYKIDNFQFLETNGTLIPFVKWQYFDGYNKAETNAPENHVNDWELGVEWQLAPEVEIMAEYHHMKRNNLVTGNLARAVDYQSFTADALRVQVQYNF